MLSLSLICYSWSFEKPVANVYSDLNLSILLLNRYLGQIPHVWRFEKIGSPITLTSHRKPDFIVLIIVGLTGPMYLVKEKDSLLDRHVRSCPQSYIPRSLNASKKLSPAVLACSTRSISKSVYKICMGRVYPLTG